MRCRWCGTSSLLIPVNMSRPKLHPQWGLWDIAVPLCHGPPREDRGALAILSFCQRTLVVWLVAIRCKYYRFFCWDDTLLFWSIDQASANMACEELRMSSHAQQWLQDNKEWQTLTCHSGHEAPLLCPAPRSQWIALYRVRERAYIDTWKVTSQQQRSARGAEKLWHWAIPSLFHSPPNPKASQIWGGFPRFCYLIIYAPPSPPFWP